MSHYWSSIERISFGMTWFKKANNSFYFYRFSFHFNFALPMEREGGWILIRVTHEETHGSHGDGDGAAFLGR